jgi:hypothetical protein
LKPAYAVSGERLFTFRASLGEMNWGPADRALQPPRDWREPYAVPLLLETTLKGQKELRALDPRQEYEFRYWWNSNIHILGELESIRDESKKVVDPSICELHQLPMARVTVPILWGLRMDQPDQDDCPNAAAVFGGCIVHEPSPEAKGAYVCPRCDVIYQTKLNQLLERLEKLKKR